MTRASGFVKITTNRGADLTLQGAPSSLITPATQARRRRRRRAGSGSRRRGVRIYIMRLQEQCCYLLACAPL